MTGAGEAVEAGAAVVIRGAPIGGDRAFLLEAEQDGVKGALVDREKVAADLLNAPGDAVAVQGAENIEGAEHHEGEGALLDVFFLLHAISGNLGPPLVYQQEYDITPLGKQQVFAPSNVGPGGNDTLAESLIETGFASESRLVFRNFPKNSATSMSPLCTDEPILIGPAKEDRNDQQPICETDGHNT